MAKQQDWIGLQAKLAEYRRSFRAAVKRQTVKAVARDARIDPDTLSHQASEWTPRRHPSADAAFVLLHSDEEHQGEVMGQLGKLVIPPPTMTAADALRTAVAKSAKGFVSSQELAELLAQTDLGGDL